MKKLANVLPVLVVVLLSACARESPAGTAATGCKELLGTKLGTGIVEKAAPVQAGESLSLMGVDKKPTAPFAFCRVLTKLQSEPGSEIQSEFWLPDPGAWNGKFVGLGNGGFGGVIQEAQLFGPLRMGYAVASSDMGHPPSFPKALAPLNAKWAFEQPVKVEDWAHRANHLTAQTGKELVGRFYGRQPKRSYFHGCSDGGREALMEAGRYPDDYDGVLVGAPAAAFTDIAAHFIWNARVLAPVDLTPKLGLLRDAVLARCDALDGVKDGVLESPPRCDFDPATLQCPSTDGPGCLTKAEVEAVRAIYQGPRTSKGVQVSSGFSLGGEDDKNWALWMTGPNVPVIGTVKKMTGQRMLATDFYRWMVFADPDWSIEGFDLDRDWTIGRERLAALVNANDFDMAPFFGHDKKLLVYHGWSDAALPPQNTINYVDKLRGRYADAASQRLRLFMVPGMGHCMGGAGPSVFDALTALDQWVEGGAPPERIVTSKFDDDMAGALGLAAKLVRTRPLCAWPNVARWSGNGSSDAAENFNCVDPNTK